MAGLLHSWLSEANFTKEPEPRPLLLKSGVGGRRPFGFVRIDRLCGGRPLFTAIFTSADVALFGSGRRSAAAVGFVFQFQTQNYGMDVLKTRHNTGNQSESG